LQKNSTVAVFPTSPIVFMPLVMNVTPAAAASERTIITIALGLILGIAMFGAVVLFLISGQFQPVKWCLMENMSIALGLGCFIASSTLPGLITRQNLSRLRSEGVILPDPANRGRLLGVYEFQLRVGYALVVGAALFGLIVALMEHSVAGMAVAGVCLLVMIARFPTASRIEAWIHQHTVDAEWQRPG
jgi:hypothetical protein